MNAPILAQAVSALKKEEKRHVWERLISEFLDFWTSMFTMPFRSPLMRTAVIAGVCGFMIGQVLVVVPDTGSLAVAWPRMSLQVMLQSVLAICAHALLVWATLTSVVSLIVSIVIDGVLSGPKSQL